MISNGIIYIIIARYDLYFPMFRGIGLFLFYFWLLSLNVYVWNKSHINYK
jgi:hypothetical protein